MRALRVFLPQLIGAAIATAGVTTWYGIYVAHPVAVIPVGIVTLASGLLTFLTTVDKSVDITSEADWQRLDWGGGCKNCKRLAADLDETRRALVELKP